MCSPFIVFGMMCQYPNSYTKLHFLEATMFTVHSLYMQGGPDLSSYGDIDEKEYGFGTDQPPTSVLMKEQFQRQIMYNMSPIEVSGWYPCIFSFV